MTNLVTLPGQLPRLTEKLHTAGSRSVTRYPWRVPSYHIISICNGFANAPTRYGSPLRWGPDDLQEAVATGWMVIEAVPESIDIKTEVFSELDRLAEPDAILRSNSSSISTSQMIGKVEHPERVLNTHYQQLPELNAVELMSCGKTDEGIIDALMEKIPQYGLVPFHVRRESDGFIFNRIWAAIKRECLMVVEEGVAPPEDVDAMWEMLTHASVPPISSHGPRRPGRRAGHRGALRRRA